MRPSPDTLRGLIERADLSAHIQRTLTVGIPRLDPKTRETVARQIALKVCLALLTQATAEAGGPHAGR